MHDGADRCLNAARLFMLQLESEMIRYLSTTGGSPAVDFETAILQGFATDGGLFVPDRLPTVTPAMLDQWSKLSYTALAAEVVSLFMDHRTISPEALRQMLQSSFSAFSHPEIIPVVRPSPDEHLWVMELFHGPTLSFKDVAMGFLVNLLNLLLKRCGRHASLVVVTSGDTGPAAAHAAKGKSHLDCWVLFPAGMISDAQQRQMTTIESPNVHAVSVDSCPGGCDDLDQVVSQLFEDKSFKRQVGLSSVNSINWGRVMMQIVHYFYGYFRVAATSGDPVTFSIPTGAVGNLFSGHLARCMGLPIDTLIAANNQNASVHRLLTTGRLTRTDLVQSVSSAIDIVDPCNHWRYLYVAADGDHRRILRWKKQYAETGQVTLDAATMANLGRGLSSTAVDDGMALDTMATMYDRHGYLLDPHGAVAVAGARQAAQHSVTASPIVCLATAHPAKFPEAVRRALNLSGRLPQAATHESVRQAATCLQRLRTGSLDNLGDALKRSMRAMAG